MKEENYSISIAGPQQLSGEVTISGAKNAALPCLAAAILTSEPVWLQNVPDVLDIKRMLQALEAIGATIEYQKTVINCKNLHSFCAVHPEIGKTRAAILFLAPLLARFKNAEIAFPGGCSIGNRQINFHLQALQLMGAEFLTDQNLIRAKAKKLKGIEYRFPLKTVTGTENIIMAAVLAEGQTVLANCACEPEVTDLIFLLKKMGADIQVTDGGSTILINGLKELGGASHQIIPDRIEAGTFMCLGALKKNQITIKNVRPDHLSSLIDKFQLMQIPVMIHDNSIVVSGTEQIKPINIRTDPFPGFPTDLQAQISVLLTQAAGKSVIEETIFENRFQHFQELAKMGAKVEIKNNQAIINGRTDLYGADMVATDLRASAALVLAALIAHGQSKIANYLQLMRGYEKFDQKLQSLGASVKIEKE